MTAGAVFSMSTSGQMIAASLPPLWNRISVLDRGGSRRVRSYNSSVTLFKVFAHSSMIFFPVGIEPVKEIFWISGWLTIHGPSCSSPPRTCSTPGGKRACPTSTAFKVVYGVYGLYS